MDPKELRGLCEAYTAVYDEDLRDELEEMSDDFAGIENLSDEEIDAIVEETIDEMLEEGYDFDEVEEIFEEVLSEAARGTDRAAARREYMRSSEAAAKEARKRGAAVVKKEKRAEKIAQVKDAVKSALGKAKEAVKSGASKAKSAARELVDKPARRYAAGRGLISSKSGKSKLGTGETGQGGIKQKQQTSAGRREVRSAVASDIKGRIKQKIAKAQVDAYGAARKAGQAVSDAAGRAKQSAKNLAARTGRGAKSMVGKAARSVATGAGKVASRLGEDVDVYDIVLEHLIENGYAESYEAAEKIMVNMSEEWRDEILDEANKVERELGLSSRAREQARNLNRNADKPIFYTNTLMGKSSDSNLNRAHKQMTAKRQASHKAGRHLRGDAGEKGNVVKSRYQANKDHTDGYPSITKRGQGPT